MHHDRPKKLQRISQACDLCHRRSIRCRPSTENPDQKCQNCFDFGVACTFQRPSRRRRNKSEPRVSPPNITPSRQRVPSPFSPSGPVEAVAQKGNISSRKATGLGQGSPAYLPFQHGPHPYHRTEFAWRSFASASAQMINECLRVYMDFVYPILPLFHGPTLWEHIRHARHLEDHALFASVMAACALAAARSRDGATERRSQSQVNLADSADVFFQAASDAVFADPDRATGFGYLRACVLLAATSVQSGQALGVHQYLGRYVTLSTMQRFHDESTWPAALSIIEREEHRRLFWSAYSLDIFTSVVFDNPPRSQEVFANVCYPSEADDEALTLGLVQQSDGVSWIRAWNVVTDLHRLLEHAAKRSHWHKLSRPSQPMVECLSGLGIHSDGQTLTDVLNLYYSLPAEFKAIHVPSTSNRTQHILGFQVVNIQATYQLVRIMLLNLTQPSDPQQKCEVVGQMLSAFRSMARSYLQASSTPLIYHLATIGRMLGSIMQGIVAEDAYQHARGLLESLADLLEELECGLQAVCGASQELREVMGKMDQYMANQRQLLPTAGTVQVTSPDMQIRGRPKKGPFITTATMRQSSKVRETRPALDEFQLQRSMPGDWAWPFDFSQEPDGSTLSG